MKRSRSPTSPRSPRSPQQRKKFIIVEPNIFMTTCKICNSPRARTMTCPLNIFIDPLKERLSENDIKEHSTIKDDYNEILNDYYSIIWDTLDISLNKKLTYRETREIIRKFSDSIQFPNLMITDENEYSQHIENFAYFVYGACLGEQFDDGTDIDVLNHAIYQYSTDPVKGWRNIVNGIKYFFNS